MFLYKTAKRSIFKVAEYVFIIGNNLELPRGFNHAPGNRQQVKVKKSTQGGAEQTGGV